MATNTLTDDIRVYYNTNAQIDDVPVNIKYLN